MFNKQSDKKLEFIESTLYKQSLLKSLLNEFKELKNLYS